MTPAPQPSGLGELAASAILGINSRQGTIQRVQVSSAAGAAKPKEPEDKSSRKSSPTPATRPKRYALELWVEIEVSPGVYVTPEDNSYGIDFVIETINQAYLGCTSMYLDVASHMVAFYGKKASLMAGLLHEEGIQASQAITSIPMWMGYPATWRVQCVSISEASEIVTACKRLEWENWRRACWELQDRFSALWLNSTLSAAARPFQPQTASGSTLAAAPPQDHPYSGRPVMGSPTVGGTGYSHGKGTHHPSLYL